MANTVNIFSKQRTCGRLNVENGPIYKKENININVPAGVVQGYFQIFDAISYRKQVVSPHKFQVLYLNKQILLLAVLK